MLRSCERILFDNRYFDGCFLAVDIIWNIYHKVYIQLFLVRFLLYKLFVYFHYLFFVLHDNFHCSGKSSCCYSIQFSYHYLILFFFNNRYFDGCFLAVVKSYCDISGAGLHSLEIACPVGLCHLYNR